MSIALFFLLAFFSLILFALVSWSLCWRWMGGLVEAQRTRLNAASLLREALLYQNSVTASRAASRFRSQARLLVDLDGSRVCVSPDKLPYFRALCCLELEVSPDASWSEIRSHWRRRSLQWHPDLGGALEGWLRKQRAYQALKALND